MSPSGCSENYKTTVLI